MIISTDVATVDTSAPSGNDHKSSTIRFSYAFFNRGTFARILSLTAPVIRSSQEEAVAPIILDSVGVDVLYRSIIQH